MTSWMPLLRRNATERRRRRARAGLILVALVASGCSSFMERVRAGTAFRRISPDIAFTLMRDVPGVGILDLREPDEFAGPDGHIHGAVNVPLSDLDRRLGEITVWRNLAPLRKETFLVYCRGGDACGEEGVRILVQRGFTNAVLLAGGIDAWKASGYGVLGPQPGASDDPTLRSFATPTHWRRLSDGELIEGSRDEVEGLFVSGIVRSERFLPIGAVEGTGPFCGAWWRRDERGIPGWMELRSGKFYTDSTPRDPASPYVRGCRAADGSFRPESRNVQ